MWERINSCAISGGTIGLNDTVVIKSAALLLEDKVCDSKKHALEIFKSIRNACGNKPIKVESIFQSGSKNSLTFFDNTSILSSVFFMKYSKKEKRPSKIPSSSNFQIPSNIPLGYII